ncbi:MAG: hypothetical protein B6244_07125 [Candidatus Cloacimonetes bacterium 4572_55]|nr:MAG: hypothetical protein B6244_07125 [Candidatus Cloacimonetes bacterium 4572_55]
MFRCSNELCSHHPGFAHFCQSIEVFSCDMWDGYVSTAKNVFPNAEIVIDRFHFFGQMSKALDNVRMDSETSITFD